MTDSDSIADGFYVGVDPDPNIPPVLLELEEIARMYRDGTIDDSTQIYDGAWTVVGKCSIFPTLIDAKFDVFDIKDEAELLGTLRKRASAGIEAFRTTIDTSLVVMGSLDEYASRGVRRLVEKAKNANGTMVILGPNKKEITKRCVAMLLEGDRNETVRRQYEAAETLLSHFSPFTNNTSSSSLMQWLEFHLDPRDLSRIAGARAVNYFMPITAASVRSETLKTMAETIKAKQSLLIEAGKTLGFSREEMDEAVEFARGLSALAECFPLTGGEKQEEEDTARWTVVATCLKLHDVAPLRTAMCTKTMRMKDQVTTFRIVDRKQIAQRRDAFVRAGVCGLLNWILMRFNSLYALESSTATPKFVGILDVPHSSEEDGYDAMCVDFAETLVRETILGKRLEAFQRFRQEETGSESPDLPQEDEDHAEFLRVMSNVVFPVLDEITRVHSNGSLDDMFLARLNSSCDGSLRVRKSITRFEVGRNGRSFSAVGMTGAHRVELPLEMMDAVSATTTTSSSLLSFTVSSAAALARRNGTEMMVGLRALLESLTPRLTPLSAFPLLTLTGLPALGDDLSAATTALATHRAFPTLVSAPPAAIPSREAFERRYSPSDLEGHETAIHIGKKSECVMITEQTLNSIEAKRHRRIVYEVLPPIQCRVRTFLLRTAYTRLMACEKEMDSLIDEVEKAELETTDDDKALREFCARMAACAARYESNRLYRMHRVHTPSYQPMKVKQLRVGMRLKAEKEASRMLSRSFPSYGEDEEEKETDAATEAWDFLSKLKAKQVVVGKNVRALDKALEEYARGGYLETRARRAFAEFTRESFRRMIANAEKRGVRQAAELDRARKLLALDEVRFGVRRLQHLAEVKRQRAELEEVATTERQERNSSESSAEARKAEMEVALREVAEAQIRAKRALFRLEDLPFLRGASSQMPSHHHMTHVATVSTSLFSSLLPSSQQRQARNQNENNNTKRFGVRLVSRGASDHLPVDFRPTTRALTAPLTRLETANEVKLALQFSQRLLEHVHQRDTSLLYNVAPFISSETLHREVVLQIIKQLNVAEVPSDAAPDARSDEIRRTLNSLWTLLGVVLSLRPIPKVIQFHVLSWLMERLGAESASTSSLSPPEIARRREAFRKFADLVWEADGRGANGTGGAKPKKTRKAANVDDSREMSALLKKFGGVHFEDARHAGVSRGAEGLANGEGQAAVAPAPRAAAVAETVVEEDKEEEERRKMRFRSVQPVKLVDGAWMRAGGNALFAGGPGGDAAVTKPQGEERAKMDSIRKSVISAMEEAEKRKTRLRRAGGTCVAIDEEDENEASDENRNDANKVNILAEEDDADNAGPVKYEPSAVVLDAFLSTHTKCQVVADYSDPDGEDDVYLPIRKNDFVYVSAASEKRDWLFCVTPQRRERKGWVPSTFVVFYKPE